MLAVGEYRSETMVGSARGTGALNDVVNGGNS